MANIADRASGYSMPGVTVEDGQDVLRVYAAVAEAVQRARAGEGPSLVEVMTYRYSEHSEGLRHAGVYRPDDEHAAWVSRDPIVRFRMVLSEEHDVDDDTLDALAAGIEGEIEEAVAFARASEFPAPAEAYERPVLHAGGRARDERRKEHHVTTMTYLAAIGQAQLEAMEEDERVVVLGEDIRSNLYGTAPGFLERFGPSRVWDTPISEEGFTGLGAGAAMTGLRPVVDLTYASFMYMAMDQFVNQIAKNRYMFGGQAMIPVTYRASMFYGASMAAHHSDRPYPMFMNVPGLTILAPSTPHDARGLLRSAIRLDDPVLVFEDATLWFQKQDLPDEPYTTPIGVARVVRSGDDVTLVAIAGSVRHAEAAAEVLASEGVSVEVIDPPHPGAPSTPRRSSSRCTGRDDW